MITAATRPFVLLGDPVEHSLSPRMQNAALAALRLDGVYVALRCEKAHVAPLVHAFARGGGGGNVTLPHKIAAAAAIERATEPVRRTGACNTFWLEDERIHGDNTDVAAIASVAARLTGGAAGARALLLGAGGSAAAALCALLDQGADHVTVVNRSPARAEALIRRLDPAGSRVVTGAREAIASERFDLIVNATSLGLRGGDPLPLRFDEVTASAALDLVYRPGGTAWVRHAGELGVRALDGIEVLVAQGAAAFERWWRRPAPVDVMRAAVG